MTVLKDATKKRKVPANHIDRALGYLLKAIAELQKADLDPELKEVADGLEQVFGKMAAKP